MRTATIFVGFASAILALGGTTALADDFYKGKTIKLTVAASANSGYTNHSRTLAKYIGRHLPGNPTVVVQGMPAAGGLVGVNYMFNNAARDGTEFGMLNRNALLSGVLGVEQAMFKAEEFTWLGTVASFSDNAHLYIIRNDLPHKSIEDMRGDKLPQVVVGNSGSALVRILKEALGFNIKIVEGYTNNDLDPAFERKEIDGHTISYLSMMLRVPHWIEKGFSRPVVQFGRTTRLPALPDVPTARELVQDREKLALILLTEAPLQIGYPFAMPPNVPADRVSIMRKGFRDTLEDPDYRSEIGKLQLELTPKFHEDVLAILKEINNAPAPAKKRYKELLDVGGN